MIDKEPVVLKVGIEETLTFPKMVDGYTTVGMIESNLIGENISLEVRGICEPTDDEQKGKTFKVNVILDSALVGFSLFDKDSANNKYRYISFKADEDINIKFSLVEDKI